MCQVGSSPATLSSAAHISDCPGRTVVPCGLLEVGEVASAELCLACPGRSLLPKHPLKPCRQLVVVQLSTGRPLLLFDSLLRVSHQPLQCDFLLRPPHNNACEEMGRRDGDVLSPRNLGDPLIEGLPLKVPTDYRVDSNALARHVPDNCKGIMAERTAVGETVRIAPKAVRRSISNDDCDLGAVGTVAKVKAIMQTVRNSFGSISAPRCSHSIHPSLHILDVASKVMRVCYEALVLRGMVAIGNRRESHISGFGGDDVTDDALDVLLCATDPRAHRPSVVNDKY
mmetsp:Transcript_4512/g.7856  ORF Transcript_4512/g.7856 Transcript_4512/m.7856 type:complete len:284 (+) Transcript_4512:134-985(+)